MTSMTRASCVLAMVLSATACADRTTPPPEPTVVSNTALGIALEGLPSDFKVEVNQGDQLVLAPAAEVTEGRLSLAVEPKPAGVNLVAAVQRHQEEISSRPGGDYRGAQELATHLGTAFWSRGVFEDDGKVLEEARILTIHPSRQALLSLTYVFPAADNSATRMEQLLDVLAVVEPAGE